MAEKEWNESDHPRGQPGYPQRFVEKGNETEDTLNMSTAELKKRQTIKLDSDNPLVKFPKPEKAYGFEDKRRKYSPDHVQHAKEMGFKNQDEYENAAIDFWDKGEGEIFYGNKRNRFAKYNSHTGEYIVVDPDSTLRTYYKINLKKFIRIQKQEGLTEWRK